MFNWFKLLWSLNDERLIEINGFEYTLYLVWIRKLAIFFAFITLFNGTFNMPTYLTGYPEIDPLTHAPKSLNSTMDEITLLNVTGREPKLAFAFLCQLIVPACLLFFILRRFRQKFTVQK